MGINTVPQPHYNPNLVPCDFWLFPKLTGCRSETIEERKETVTKVFGTLTQEDFHGAVHKLLERYNSCIAAEGDYLEGDKSFMCVLSIKVSKRKKSGNLFNDPRTYILIIYEFLRQSLMIFIIQDFWTIVFIPMVVFTTFFDRCGLRPFSDLSCRTLEPTWNFNLFNSSGSIALIPSTITGY